MSNGARERGSGVLQDKTQPFLAFFHHMVPARLASPCALRTALWSAPAVFKRAIEINFTYLPFSIASARRDPRQTT